MLGPVCAQWVPSKVKVTARPASSTSTPLTILWRWNCVGLVHSPAVPLPRHSQTVSALPLGSGLGLAKALVASSCGARAADTVT